MEELKEAIKSDKTEDIKTKTQQLMTSSMKLGEAIYKAQQDTAAGASKTDAKPDDKKDVVDAEFEEVKDDNKKNG
jgi:molecular chaperone DnaK